MHLLVGGPAGTGIFFLACEDYKKLELFQMLTCPRPGDQMLLRYK